MINKILIGILFAAIGAVAAYEYKIDADLYDRMNKFMNAGARFTAQDGLLLCERIKTLELVLYDHRDIGNPPLSCNYIGRQ